MPPSSAAHDTELRRGASGGPLRKSPRLPESVYGRYRWLLHLDGHSFSNRLQSLLTTNSAVFKQVSQASQVSQVSQVLQVLQVGCKCCKCRK